MGRNTQFFFIFLWLDDKEQKGAKYEAPGRACVPFIHLACVFLCVCVAD